MASPLILKQLSSMVVRPYGRAPLQYRTSLRTAIRYSSSEHLPKLAQSSIWQSIIPKFLRTRDKRQLPTEKKPPNPASYFIWIYLFIGSQAIRIIGVQNEYKTFMRKAEVKIAKLREVIEKLQRGEEVDVEKVLGTGDETQELEWEEALREIENEDKLWQTNRQKQREAKAKQEAEEQEASPINESSDKTFGVDESASAPTQAPPGFY
jgi:Family of unknown function (DUF5321)